MSPRSPATNVYAAEAAPLLSYTRHTGTASSAPRGNVKWIFKPSDTLFLPIGRMVPTTTNLTPGNTNNCELTLPRAKSPAPTANATYRVPTDLSLTTSTAPAFYPLLCLTGPPFGTIPLMALGGLGKSSNPPMPTGATSYDSLTIQVLH